MKRFAAVILLQMISLGACTQTRAGAAGSAARGRQLFTQNYCYECHGAMAQGVPQAGPRIGPPERTLPDFLQFVRAPIGDMAPVSPARVSDAALTDIYAWLRSIPAPPKAGAGNAARGKAIYAANCALCHGAQAQGLPENGAKLAGIAAAFSEFTGFVRMPGGNMAPVSPARVSDAQLADVYAYLQSLPSR